jgi:hypothetical protein
MRFFEQAYQWIISGTSKTDWPTWVLLLVQAWIFRRQADISDKQATLTHQTYLTANRPRLRIRNVVVHRTSLGRLDESATLFQDYEFVGQCYVTNIGGTDAKILESHLIVYANQMGLPMERPYEGKDANNPINPSTLEAGKSLPVPFREISPLTAGEPDRARRGEHPLFIMGWVSYGDHNGTMHRTAFCRRWDAGK